MPPVSLGVWQIANLQGRSQEDCCPFGSGSSIVPGIASISLQTSSHSFGVMSCKPFAFALIKYLSYPLGIFWEVSIE